jgi:molybdate transport system substrate-binding protein
MRTLAAAVLAALCLAAAPPGRAQAPVTVFAAASLANALEDVGKAYAAQGRPAVRFSFAASSTLAKQMEAGAPAALFASADEAWMAFAASRNLVDAASRRTLATNRLVLVVPADRPATVDLASPGALTAWLGDGRLATGDPAHVPVGRYAREALTAIGAWGSVAPRLVRAENVRSALAFVERGEVAAGIVYATDAAATTKVRVAGTFAAGTHAPIVYPVALAAGANGERGRAFYAFLVASDEARAILRKHGFGAPRPS